MHSVHVQPFTQGINRQQKITAGWPRTQLLLLRELRAVNPNCCDREKNKSFPDLNLIQAQPCRPWQTRRPAKSRWSLAGLKSCSGFCVFTSLDLLCSANDDGALSPSSGSWEGARPPVPRSSCPAPVRFVGHQPQENVEVDFLIMRVRFWVRAPVTPPFSHFSARVEGLGCGWVRNAALSDCSSGRISGRPSLVGCPWGLFHRHVVVLYF